MGGLFWKEVPMGSTAGETAVNEQKGRAVDGLGERLIVHRSTGHTLGISLN